MLQRNRKSAIVALVAVGCLFQLPTIFAQEVLVKYKMGSDYANAVGRTWTKEMFENAQPMEWHNDASASSTSFSNDPEILGSPGSSPSGRPGTAAASEDVPPVESDDLSVDYGTQDRFDAYPAYNYKWSKSRFPWEAIGKLFFETPGGTSWCSASVIGKNDVIVTAAHCCWDDGDFYDNWLFVPGTDTKGNKDPFEPIGKKFSWQEVAVPTAWATTGGREYDVCVLKMDKNLSKRTGWLGRSWNQSQAEHVHTIGYPENKSDGLRQEVCASENMQNCGTSTVVNATGCDKTYGDSGGPWIRVFRPNESGANNYVNSVTSGWDGCTGTWGQTYNGARFADHNIVLLCDSVGCDD